MDGAADWPLPSYSNRTCLELAEKPNLDTMAKEGVVGLANMVPQGMEPTSACACMSVLGYDPAVYYRGRSGIEAKSMGVPVGPDDVVFRCNLVALRHDTMWSYSAGYISSEDARQLVDALNEKLGYNNVKIFPGVGFRQIMRITGRPDTLLAKCTAPHDITDQKVTDYLPQGEGSDLLNELMEKSRKIMMEHPINLRRKVTGAIPASQIWLFWGSGQIPEMPPFRRIYNLNAAMTSAVDLLKGLAQMMDIQVLEIPGVTDGLDNDYAAQADGALKALETKDMVVIHVEAPDEAGHDGSVERKIEAIEKIDAEIVGRIRSWKKDEISIMVTPDHPTPVKLKTHCDDPVPFLLWGKEFKPSGASAYSESEAGKTGVKMEKGYRLMDMFAGRK